MFNLDPSTRYHSLQCALSSSSLFDSLSSDLGRAVPSSIEERRALIKAKKAKGSSEEPELQPEGEMAVEGKKPSKQERRQMKKAERKSDREEEEAAAAAARAQDLVSVQIER